MKRVLLGMLLTPLVCASAMAFVGVILFGNSVDSIEQFRWSDLFLLALPIAYGAMSVFGVPIVWFLIRRCRLALTDSLLGGSVAAVAITAGLLPVFWWTFPSLEGVWVMGIITIHACAFFAGISGFCFWCIALWRNTHFNTLVATKSLRAAAP